MATVTAMTNEERKALARARRLFPDVPRIELAGRIRKAAKLGRGRPPVELAGLAPLTRVIDTSRSVNSLARAMPA